MKTLILTLLAAAATTAAGALPPEIRDALGKAASYEEGQSRVALIAVDHFTAQHASDAKIRRELAAAMASQLGATGTTASARTFLCRQLGFIGGKAEIATIAKLLNDPATVDDARTALESMPDSAAGSALRRALDRAQGLAAAGLMHSLARRGDEKALPQFAARLEDGDPAVAEAAGQALAMLGTKRSLDALARAKGPWAAAARRECALRLADRGEIATADAAFRGFFAAAADSGEKVAVLSAWSSLDGKAAGAITESLESPDPLISLTAIRLAAPPASGVTTESLTAALTTRDEFRQAALLRALGDRGDASALPALNARAVEGSEAVRIAALEAIGRLGTAESVATLAGVAASSAGALRLAAVAALGSLRGSGVDEAVLKGLDDPDPVRRTAMIEAVVARHMSAATPRLLQAAAGGDATAAAAASGLAHLADATTYPQVVQAMMKTPTAELRRAVIAAGRRMSDEAAKIRPLVEALDGGTADAEGVAAALGVLAEFGGGPALAAVRERVTAKDVVVREAAVKALAGWPDAAAAGDLLGILPGQPDPALRAVVLRGFLQLAPTSPQALTLLRQAAPSLLSDNERRQWLGAAGHVSSVDALDLVRSQLRNPAVAAEAAAAALTIAEKIAMAQPAAADAAVRDVLATAEATALAGRARALQETIAGLLKSARMRREARIEALQKETGPAGRVALYLDCGPETTVEGIDGLRATVTAGTSWAWRAMPRAEGPEGTCAFAEQEVTIELSGLKPGRAYRVGWTWWDFDARGRKQSVWIAGRQAVGATALPAWIGQPQKLVFVSTAIPAEVIRDGKVSVTVRREEGANAVLSELWLVDDAASATTAAAEDARKVLIVTGLDHPAHKWRETAPVLQAAIAKDPRLKVEVSEDVSVLGRIRPGEYAAIVLHYMNWQNPGPSAEVLENFRRCIEDGTGLVMVHFACGAFQAWPEFVKIAGRVWNPKFRAHDPRGPFTVQVTDRTHPVTAGLDDFETTDELYTCLDGTTPIQALAQAKSKVDQKDYPMAFVLEYGKGRVFQCVLGHDVKAMEPEAVGALYRRGTAWAAGLKP